jgi:hypothetical protein
MMLKRFCVIQLKNNSLQKADRNNQLARYLETKGMSWENCVGICTGGAPSMVGSITGFTSLAKKEK